MNSEDQRYYARLLRITPNQQKESLDGRHGIELALDRDSFEFEALVRSAVRGPGLI